MTPSTRAALLAPTVAVTLVVVWELGARGGAVDELFFPRPSLIVDAIVEDIRDGDLPRAALDTLWRALRGLAIGGFIGLLTGFAMGSSSFFRRLFDPFVAALHPVPKLALFPLALIIFGLGDTASVAIISLAAFFPMAITTAAGVRQLDPTYFEVASVYGAGRAETTRSILFPGTRPIAFAGARLSLNAALVSTVAIELAMPSSGLGAVIWRAWETLQTAKMFGAIVTISLMGVGLNALLTLARRHFVPWQVDSP